MGPLSSLIPMAHVIDYLCYAICGHIILMKLICLVRKSDTNLVYNLCVIYLASEKLRYLGCLGPHEAWGPGPSGPIG